MTVVLERSARAPVYGVPSIVAERRPQLRTLEGLRFAAALHLVCFHLAIGIQRVLDRLPGWLDGFLVRGYTSTSLFFILSGFVLAYAYTANEGGFRGSPQKFWAARFARLYPLAVLGFLISIPVTWYEPAEAAVRAALVLTGTQAWLPWAQTSFDAPSWSLSALAFFYAIFPFVLQCLRGRSRRSLAWAAGAAWGAMLVPSVAVWILQGGAEADSLTAVIRTVPVFRAAEFVFGVVLGTLYVQHTEWMRRLAAPLLLPAVMVLTVALCAGDDIPYAILHNGLLAPVHGLIIVGVAGGRGVAGTLLGSRVARVLGKASLPLYLLHVPLISWTIVLLNGAGPEPTAVMLRAFAGYVVVTASLSLAVSRWFVDPLARVLREWPLWRVAR